MRKLAHSKLFIVSALIVGAGFVSSCGSHGGGESQTVASPLPSQPTKNTGGGPAQSQSPRAPVTATNESLSVGFGTVCQILSAEAGVQCTNYSQGQVARYRVPVNSPVEVSVGSAHACALGSDGVKCWLNTQPAGLIAPLNDLGNSIKIRLGFAFSWPVVNSASIFQQLDREYACAVNSAGELKCWSWRGASAALPAKTPVLKGVGDVAVGNSQACAVTTSGVQCWFWNESGEVARLATPALASTAGAHISLGTPADLEAEVPRVACTTAAGTSPTLQCWAWIATGGMVQLPTPTLDHPAQLGIAGNEACALAEDGVHCWLWTRQGSQFALTPVTVPGLSQPKLLSLSFESICIEDKTGGRCWGREFDEGSAFDIAPTDSIREILVLGDSLTCGPFGAELVRNLNQNPLNHVTVYCATGSRPGDWLQGTLPIRTYDQKKKKATSYYACETCKGKDCASWYNAADPSDANFKESCNSAQPGIGPKFSDILSQNPHYDAVIVALGTNTISFGDRADATYPQMLAEIKSHQVNSCTWIGPPQYDISKDPDHVPKNQKSVTQIMEDRLNPFYSTLASALQTAGCSLIDSRQASTITSPRDTISDGIHRTAAAGALWADRLAPNLDTRLETPAEADENRAPFPL